MKDLVLRLIQKHRKTGVLVDTNILLLYFLGRFSPREIPRFKRTQQFTVEDYGTLFLILKNFEKLLTTPNVLTEVNSFSGQLADPLRNLYFKRFASEIGLLEERYVESNRVAELHEFVRLGLTDTGILSFVSSGSHLVLTDDFPLSQRLQGTGIDVINFNHVRLLGWK
jgi:rRNA-processing protein FCF1